MPPTPNTQDNVSWRLYKNSPKKVLKKDQPIPIDKEIILDKNKILLSTTNTQGIITYANDDFVKVSGYNEWELAGSNHNIIRHPDMPKVIFKLLWNRIQNKHNIVAIIKNLAKSGEYYWVMTDFVIQENDNGDIIGYKAYRRSISESVIEVVTPLYELLSKIEKTKGIQASEDYLIGYLDELNTTYDEFIEDLIVNNINNKENNIIISEKKVKKNGKSFWSNLFQY